MEITKPIMLDSTGQEIKEALLSIGGAISGKGRIYGFHIDESESDVSKKVTYLKDAVGMTPMAMNYETGVMNYGSWKSVLDDWLMPRPCMLKSNGTVYKYLDENDNTKYADGTDSDIANLDFDGNAMVEWGKNGKKIWYKVEPGSNNHSADVFIADYQADQNYHAYSFIDKDGNLKDHFYTPMFNGVVNNGKLRSISGLMPAGGTTAAQEITYAEANGSGWFTEILSDNTLIEFLLILLGKSTDVQTVFGKGNCNGFVNDASANYGKIVTGTMNKKGMFWGSDVSSNTETYGVKVFGMENWWGNIHRRYAGHINDNGVQKIKMTFGTEDGSIANNFNLTGEGYIEAGASPAKEGFISKMLFTPFTMIPAETLGSSTTHFPDYVWVNNGQVNYALRGGDSGNGAYCGFVFRLDFLASLAAWYFGACLSYR
jgi:hypothetical protein